MKKGFIFILALLLAVPALSYAGSATSRWDMTIGGYIKFDLGWADRAVGVDYRAAARGDIAGQDTVAKATNNIHWAAGESRLNFAIAGPEAWGAKTSAFMEGDFRGITGSGSAGYLPPPGAANVQGTATGANYGYFTLRHAYFQFMWPKTTLLVGHTWTAWGLIPSMNMLSFSENHFMKGATRIPQIRFTQMLNKNFTFQAAVQSGTSNQLSAGGSNAWDQSSISLLPHFTGEIVFSTDACGKIGAWPMKFGLGGFVGKDKFLFQSRTAQPWVIDNETITTYGGSFWWYIPIIPEKKGNKAGALGFTGNIFSGKGMGMYLPAYPGAYVNNGAYTQNHVALAGAGVNGANATSRDVREPMTWGAWAQATFYFTDKFSTNVLYGFQNNALSYGYMVGNGVANAGTVKYIDNWIVNLFYDVNAAIRLGIEYSRIKTQYAATAPQTATTGWQDRAGDINAVRVGAYYFF